MKNGRPYRIGRCTVTTKWKPSYHRRARNGQWRLFKSESTADTVAVDVVQPDKVSPRPTTMSLVFRLAFFVLVLRPGSLACPSACQCFGPIWHCTEIRSLDELVAVGHKEVEQMHLIDGRVDFPRRFLAEFPNLRLLNISRSRIACTESALWLLEIDHLVKNWTQLYCTSPQVLERTPVTKALHWIRQVDSQCPDRCVCQLLNVPQDDQYVTVTIDCIDQNLVELPKTLPSNVTIHLDLSQNQVSHNGFDPSRDAKLFFFLRNSINIFLGVHHLLLIVSCTCGLKMARETLGNVPFRVTPFRVVFCTC